MNSDQVITPLNNDIFEARRQAARVDLASRQVSANAGRQRVDYDRYRSGEKGNYSRHDVLGSSEGVGSPLK